MIPRLILLLIVFRLKRLTKIYSTKKSSHLNPVAVSEETETKLTFGMKNNRKHIK